MRQRSQQQKRSARPVCLGSGECAIAVIPVLCLPLTLEQIVGTGE
jgi:hypothetical protein